jgi:tetratricopeptide (TPR) repeat protein
MNNDSSHINLEKLIAALQNKEQELWAIDALKNLNTTDEELLGIKLFMEQNNYDVAKLQLFLNTAKLNYNNLNKSTPKPSYGWLKVAASIVLLVSFSIGGYVYYTSNNYYQQYAFHEPGLPVFMSDNSTTIDNWMTEFKDNNFVEAQQMGEELLAQNTSNDTILYYLGVIYCNLGNYQQGLINFKKVSLNNVELKNKAYFLEALCVLQTNKTEAKGYFEAIALDTSTVYTEKASEILLKEYN